MSFDLQAAFDQIDKRLKHNRDCPNGECVDMDDDLTVSGSDWELTEYGASADEY
ncbi:MAG TPA: hypothetical protein VFH39_03845 [Candidatus Saccharimonadales bacterium]|nr:hypothetical protein [Candidatus Saccharimonadales bacterium]